MAIHLVTMVGGEGWRTLEPMLAHYRDLGVDAFHVTLHLSSEDDPAREPVLDITRRFGCGLYETITGQFALVQQEAYSKPRRDYPRDWFVLADTDEFQQYPASLHDVVADCEKNEWEFTRGILLDRVARDGGLPDIDPTLTLPEQFPLGCIVTPIIQRSEPRKVTLVRGAIYVLYGQHKAPYGNGCPKEILFSPIHHYKWISTMVEHTRRRAIEFREQRLAHWVVSQNLVDHVDNNGGRFDLSIPELLVGPCDPDYSRWEEYKAQAFEAERVADLEHGGSAPKS